MTAGSPAFIPRRHLLLALAASAAPIGCGGTTRRDGSGAPACASPSDGGGPPLYCLVEPRLVRVKGARALQPGEAMLTNIDDHTAVIVARDGVGYHALSAICTHACCLVSLCRQSACTEVTSNPGECGTSEAVAIDEAGTAIACPCHGSNFRLVDGAPTKGPAMRPLPSYALTFDGPDALVDTTRGIDPATRV